MNATDFFTLDAFAQLKKDVAHQKIVPLTETPYGKKIKIKGNHYDLRISTGRYVIGDKEYHVTGWIDHAYTGTTGHREIGGGNYLKIDLTSYEAFKTAVNNTLRTFPDYIPEANEQLCWF